MLSTTNSRVTNFIAMIAMLTSNDGMLAWLLPTHCLHSLEKGPPFHRALRQYVGNPEAIYSPYDNVQQQPDGNYAFDLGSFYTVLLRWTGQHFININNQSKMLTEASKGPSAGRICNDPSFEGTRNNMAEAEFGVFGAYSVRQRNSLLIKRLSGHQRPHICHWSI